MAIFVFFRDLFLFNVYLKIEIIKALNQNFNLPFLRNEFFEYWTTSKIDLSDIVDQKKESKLMRKS